MTGLLGDPVRTEEWYAITSDIYRCNITVYPGEIVAVSEKALLWLLGEPIHDTDPEGDWTLMKYDELEECMRELGFGKM